ncbi:MAG: hypothetical protein OXN16_09250 [Gammaproteobacteria bacterium]|nr:hypothetical protein [Gammaproteobacteria bacterium]MXY64710.1 hypothetical protein [Gammaproteobacteria bacterium]MYG65736.1 hypothetical protein [Gammaproteobacteria bacterium]
MPTVRVRTIAGASARYPTTCFARFRILDLALFRVLARLPDIQGKASPGAVTEPVVLHRIGRTLTGKPVE